jgi:serine/threonine protein kinase
MFGFAQTFIKQTMNTLTSAIYANANTDLIIDSEPMIKIIDMDSINDNVTTVDPIPVEVQVPVPVPVPIAAHVAKFEYENEIDVINKWKVAAKDDIVPLIAMIRQLYFFSDCRKITLRTYSLCKEEIPNYIGKIKRRPELKIDVSDVDIHDHPQMFSMYRRLRPMIGMFRVNDFMVRVEHAFDNSQITSEHFVVSQIIKHVNDPTGGIDPVHHIVLPTCVQLNNLCNVPPIYRTMFHHISYSIQPIVFHSQTMDAWFKSAIVPPTNEQIMRLCIQMAEALAHLHALGIVHGDVKPGNTLIQTIYEYADSGSSSSSSSSDSESESELLQSQAQSPSLSLYLIDFGMSGSPGHSDGTGGTKPFCAPETGNGFALKMDMDTYTWTKTQKHHDMWSFALMFFTFIVLRKSTAYPKDYPSDFFDVGRSGHINVAYFDKIQDEPMRNLFRRALCPAEDRITAAEFLAAANNVVSANVVSVNVVSDN